MAKKPTYKSRPEAAIQKRIIAMLRDRGWFCRSTHGNAYQRGFPDIFAYNDSFAKLPWGALRWIDCKVKGRSRYTKAQCQEWPEWELGNVGIWIMFEGDDENYKNLFQPPNFREFWRPSYDKYTTPVQEILKELE